MTGKQALLVLVGRRIFQLRQLVKLDTQRLRTKTIERLDKLFAVATSIASGEVQWQRFGKDKVLITQKQRQMWAHVAAHIAAIMGHLATQYDEKQFEEDLAKLELLVDEIKRQNKSKEAEAGSGGGQKQGNASHASVA
jgi:predicted metal-dependent phosphoesterase TrpH